MKKSTIKSFVVLTIICSPLTSLAQTNTFPTSGNVGIGTMSPTQKLHVLGSGVNDGLITAESSGSVSIVTKNAYGSTTLFNAGANDNFMNGTATGDGGIRFGSASKFVIGTYLSAFFSISNSGNVGVGIVQPEERFHVVGGYIKAGTSSNGSNYVQDAQNGWKETLRILRSGNQIAAIGTDGTSKFQIFTGSNASEANIRLTIDNDGDVGIGTAEPDSKLAVKGVIHAEEVKVDLLVDGPDYVFESDYPLPSLEDTKAYIEQNKHLPGIPSSAEMQQNGVNLLEMNMKLLEKVEELTLHLIEQKERIALQSQRISELKTLSEQQAKDIEELKSRKQ